MNFIANKQQQPASATRASSSTAQYFLCSCKNTNRNKTHTHFIIHILHYTTVYVYVPIRTHLQYQCAMLNWLKNTLVTTTNIRACTTSSALYGRVIFVLNARADCLMRRQRVVFIGLSSFFFYVHTHI